MVFEKIEVRNFQKHRKLSIEFDPCCTTIVGPSDTGKSALVRAIERVVLNNPPEANFIRRGATKAKVSLTVDGKLIVRIKGKRNNSYLLDEKVFKAFGITVPTPISKLLNCSPLNFQGQHESIFWFSKGAGQVAKELNQIVDLASIDRILGAAGKKVRNAKTISELRKQEEKDLKKQKLKLNWVKLAKADLGRAQQLGAALQGVQGTAAQLAVCVKQLGVAGRVLATAQTALTAGKAAFLLGSQWRSVASKTEALQAVLTEASQREKSACQIQKELRKCEKQLSKIPVCSKCGRPLSQ